MGSGGEVIRVVLVDDHSLYRSGLRAVTGTDGGRDVVIVGEGSSADEALALVDSQRPDVLALALGVPGDALATAADIARRGLAEILLLTVEAAADLVALALEIGARGICSKEEPVKDVLGAIREVARGVEYVTPRVSRTSVMRWLEARRGCARGADILCVLTRRERQVCELLLEGCSTATVAERLGISVKTAETHRMRVMDKLQISSIAELFRLAARHHLLR